MAIKWFTGGEMASIGSSNDDFWGTVVAFTAFSLSTNHVKTGTYAIRCQPSSNEPILTPPTLASASTAVIKADVYIATLPSLAGHIYSILDLNGGNVSTNSACAITIDSSGNLVLKAYASGAEVASVSMGTIPTGQWVRLELYCDSSSNPWSVKARIDDTEYTTTAAVTARTWGICAVGCYARLSTPATNTADIYFDNIVFANNATNVDYPLGDVRVSSMRVDGVGTHVGGTTFDYTDDFSAFTALSGNTETDSYQRLDEATPNDTDGVRLKTTSATNYLEYTLSAPDMEGAVIPRAVILEARVRDADNSATTNLSVRPYDLVNEGLSAERIPITSTDTTWRMYSGTPALVNAPNAQAWTATKLDNLRVRLYGIDADPDLWCSWVGAEVAYVPAITETATNSASSTQSFDEAAADTDSSSQSGTLAIDQADAESGSSSGSGAHAQSEAIAEDFQNSSDSSQSIGERFPADEDTLDVSASSAQAIDSAEADEGSSSGSGSHATSDATAEEPQSSGDSSQTLVEEIIAAAQEETFFVSASSTQTINSAEADEGSSSGSGSSSTSDATAEYTDTSGDGSQTFDEAFASLDTLDTEATASQSFGVDATLESPQNYAAGSFTIVELFIVADALTSTGTGTETIASAISEYVLGAGTSFTNAYAASLLDGAIDDTTTVIVTNTAPYPTVFSSTLREDIDASDGFFSVDDGSGFPASGPFVVVIGTEKILVTIVTVVDGFTYFSGLTRGYDGTTADSHNTGDLVFAPLTVPFEIQIGDERMLVDAVGDGVLFVDRGVEGTTATAHADGSEILLAMESSEAPGSGGGVNELVGEAITGSAISLQCVFRAYEEGAV